MERLTERLPDGSIGVLAELLQNVEHDENGKLKTSALRYVKNLFERLAEYEDTGLTPEEIKTMAYFADERNNHPGTNYFTPKGAEIQKAIAEYKERGFTHAQMSGFLDWLKRLQISLEHMASEAYGAGYALSECGYHGWTGKPVENMNNLHREIEAQMARLYALALIGLKED